MPTSFPFVEVKLSPAALNLYFKRTALPEKDLFFPIVLSTFQGWHWLAQLIRSHNHSSANHCGSGGQRNEMEQTDCRSWGQMLSPGTKELDWSVWDHLGWKWHANWFSTRRREIGKWAGKKPCRYPTYSGNKEEQNCQATESSYSSNRTRTC